LVKTASVETAERLCAVLEQSRLLSGDSLAKAKQAAAEGGDPKTVARRWVKQGLLTPWQAGQLIGGRTELHVGKYKLIDQLGEVGLGRVYLAQHVQMDRRVALKLLSRRHSSSESVQRFLSHVRELAGIDHPNIIRAYDVDRHDDRYFLVMEYVAGTTLAKRIQDGGLATIEQAVGYCQQIADALACAHAHGVPHGDLKPGNLILDEEDQVKVLNLGLSTLKDEGGDGDTSQSSEDSGGFPFPKKLLGQERVVERFDLFALGATFGYLLTGKKDLGPSRDVAATLQRLRPELPESLAQMCQQLMVCEGDSQPTAEKCATLLAQWQKEHGGRAAPPKKKDSAEIAPAKRVETSRKADADDPTVAAPKKPAAAPPRKKGTTAAAVAPIAPAAEADHDAPSGFSIQLNRPPAVPPPVSTDGSAAPAGAAAVASSAATPIPPAANANAGSPMMTILLAAGFGGVLLLGSIYGIWTWMGSGGPAVAVVDPTKATTPEDKKGEVPPGDKPEEKKTEEKKPEGTTPEKKPEEKKTEEKKPEEKKPVEKKPETTPVKPETKPPAEKKPEEKKPEETKPPEKQPDPPMPAPVPAPMPERAKALRDVPDAVELPAIVKGAAPAPTVLGKIEMQKDDNLVIGLLGGEKANGRGKQHFSLVTKGGSENEWEFKIASGPASAAGGGEGDVSIGKLSVADGELRFEWTPEGLADDTSNYVRNCALGIRCGGDAKNISLRKPVDVETFVLMFDKLIIPKKELKKIDFLPDPSLLRLEVLPLELPGSHVEPKEVPLEGGLIDIVFGEGEKAVFKVTLESKVANKRVPTLGLSPMRQMPGALGAGGGMQWVKFAPAQLGKELQFLQGSISQMGAQSNAMGKAIGAAPGQQKQVLTQQKAQLDYQIEANQETIKRFEVLNEQVTGVHEKAQIIYQIVYPAGEARVVIAKAVPGLNPEKPKRGPVNPKMLPIGGGVDELPGGLKLEPQK